MPRSKPAPRAKWLGARHRGVRISSFDARQARMGPDHNPNDPNYEGLSALARIKLPPPPMPDTNPQAFKIYPPKFSVDVPTKRPLNELFPKLPFGPVVVNGPTGSGKSNVIANIFGRDVGYGGMRDDGTETERIVESVFVFSATARHDPAWKPFLNLPWWVFEDAYDDAKLAAIVASQKAVPEEHRPMIAVIFDDPYADQTFRRSKQAQEFPAHCRHYRCIPVYIAQKFKTFPPVVRNNAHMFIIFDEGNYKELMKFLEEYDNFFGGRDNFEAMVRFSVRDKYSFMILRPQSKEAFLRFEYRLWPLPENVPYYEMPWWKPEYGITAEASQDSKRKRDDEDKGSRDKRYVHLDDQMHRPVIQTLTRRKRTKYHFKDVGSGLESIHQPRTGLPNMNPRA